MVAYFPITGILLSVCILENTSTAVHAMSNPQYVAENVLKRDLRRWTKGYTIKQPNMDCQPTEITALMRHRAVFS